MSSNKFQISKNSKTFQKKLRSVWQLQQHVSYCLFGSKKHLMNELFEKKNLPFYKIWRCYLSHKNRNKILDWIYMQTIWKYRKTHFSRTCRRNLPPCRSTIRLMYSNFPGYFGYVPLIQQPQNNLLMHWKTYSTKTIFYSKVKQKTFLPIKWIF